MTNYATQKRHSDFLHLPPPGVGEGRGEGDPLKRDPGFRRSPSPYPPPRRGEGKTRIPCITCGSYWGE